VLIFHFFQQLVNGLYEITWVVANASQIKNVLPIVCWNTPPDIVITKKESKKSGRKTNNCEPSWQRSLKTILGVHLS